MYNEFAEQLRFAAKCIDYYYDMTSKPGCNECAMKENCQYSDGTIRINCPWYEKARYMQMRRRAMRGD